LEPKEKANRSRSILENVEFTAKAIQLIEEGKAMDPADLVKHLKISLPGVRELFNAIVEAKSITVAPVLDAFKKLENLVAELLSAMNDIESYIKGVEDVKREVNNIVRTINQALLNLKRFNVDGLKVSLKSLGK